MTDSPPANGTTRKNLLELHRWLGLSAAAIWLVQAITGILLTFHFEAEDAMLLVESWFNMHLAEDWEPDDRPDDPEDPFGGDPLGAPATLF